MNEFINDIVSSDFILILITILLSLVIRDKKLFKFKLSPLYLIDALIFVIIFNFINLNIVKFSQNEIYIVFTIYVLIKNLIVSKKLEIPFLILGLIDFLLIINTYNFLVDTSLVTTIIYLLVIVFGIQLFNLVNTKIVHSPILRTVRMIPINLVTIGIMLLIISQIFS